LYFVAGDDGVLHFTNTAAEHEAAVAQYCHKACGR
jgi:cell division protein YceG involved in septum cleavage